MKLLQNQSLVSKFFLKLIFFSLFFFSCSIFAEQDNDISIDLDKQIALMDIEILLLKAEVAIQNGEIFQVKNYLSRLEATKNILRTGMKNRLFTLKKKYYLAIKKNQYPKNTSFNIDLNNIVVLLPQSGKYEQIGNSIIDGIFSKSKEQKFNYNIRYFDTNSYDSMFDLWELVKLYNPTLVIGPLEKNKIIEFDKLNINIPTLYLNEIDNKQAYTRSLTLARTANTDVLINFLEKNNMKKVAVLFDDSNSSINLKNEFMAKQQESIESILPLEVSKSIDKSIQTLLNSNLSQNRKNWLQKTINNKLKFKQRVRPDIDLVISFLPAELAMQVKPMLQFYQNNYVEHIWFPSRLPFTNSFKSKLTYWQDTIAILPEYFIQYFNTNKQTINSLSTENKQLGTFYALGELVAEIILKIANFEVSATLSKLGTVVFDSKSQITIKPKLVWIDRGKINIQE